MGKPKCACCKREFGSASLLHQHLASDSAATCHQCCHGGGRVDAQARAPEASGDSNKRLKAMDKIQSLLHGSPATSSSQPQTDASPNNDSDPPRDSGAAPNLDALDCDDGDGGLDDGDPGFDDGHSVTPEGKPRDATLGSSKVSDKFRRHTHQARHENSVLQDNMKAAIEPMHLMDAKGGSIALCEEVMDWHVRHLEGDQQQKVSADNLHNKLIERCGVEDVMPCEVKVNLQSQEGEVPIAVHDCEAQTVDLLTDPRRRRSDFLFPGPPEDGWAPPKDVHAIADTDTGNAWRETHKKPIEPMPHTEDGRLRALCPCIFCLDGCVTGQCQNQEVEMLKFTLGLFNQRARRQHWAWRELGFVHHAAKGRGQAKNLLRQSDHSDAAHCTKDASHRSAFAPQHAEEIPDLEHFGVEHGRNASSGAVTAQDLHVQLKVLMNSYKKVEEAGGISFDLVTDGEEPQSLRSVPFIIFFKVDGKEGDKLCLQCLSKTEKVECLCNLCICPTMESHDAHRNDEPKSAPMVKSLVQQNKGKELKQMSQQLASDALHESTFAQHNDRGTHGATHLEALHSMQLGQFGHSRSTFFLQTGESSNLSVTINTLSAAMATHLQRQSDKMLPRTSSFASKGIKSGTATGHEMTGLIPVLGLAMRTTAGGNAPMNEARGKQNVHFPDEKAVGNWIVLLETQLQCEAWVKLEEIDVELVRRADLKMREHMNVCKLAMKRDILEEGVGHNTKNHHGQKHLAESILDCGVPQNIGTFDNERHHRPDKNTAKRAQMQAEKFDIQMGKKTQHGRAIALGVAETFDGHKRWECYKERGPSEDDLIDMPCLQCLHSHGPTK